MTYKEIKKMKIWETFLAGCVYGGIILFMIGNLYWLWLSFEMGSFVMFIIGVIHPAFLFAGVIGAWALVFGVPVWLERMFG